MTVLNLAISLLIGYVLGNVQSSFLIGKYVKGIDIREHGSGNAGATNALRTMGWKLGLTAFAGDMIKAIIAVVITRLIFDSSLLGLLAGAGVVIGHNWPMVLGFRGGKGISSTLGVILAYDIRLGLIIWAIVAVVIFTTKYVSLGSLLMVILMPIGILIFHPGATYELIISILLAILAIYRHRGNIVRLAKGEERKLGQKKTTAVN